MSKWGSRRSSFSIYSKGIDNVEWGYNRDKEDLPQINMGMVCCENSGLPFFYKLFTGSIVDVSTIHNILKDLQAYHLKDVLNMEPFISEIKNLILLHR